MKLFSQNFEVLTQRCDVINPKLTPKRIQTGILCTNGDRKIKTKSKRNFEVRFLFMKLFSGNLKILVLCCDVKKTQVSLLCTTGCKNIKVSKNQEHSL